jgi:hypothetical protein
MMRRWHEVNSKHYSDNRDGTTKKKSNVNNLLKPNVKTFTAVLNACARPIEKSERTDAFAIAQLTMAELSVGTYGKPNFLSYAAYLSVCATTLDPGHDRDRAVEVAFKACAEAGEVGRIVLEKLYGASSPELLEKLIGSYRDEQGQVHIPEKWNANIRGERFDFAQQVKSSDVTEKDLSCIPKSSQVRLEAVRSFGGTAGTFCRNIDRACTGRVDDTDTISWSSENGFSSKQ